MIWKNNLKRLRRSYKKPCKYISQIIVFHAFSFQTQNSDTLNTEPFERDEESVWPTWRHKPVSWLVFWTLVPAAVLQSSLPLCLLRTFALISSGHGLIIPLCIRARVPIYRGFEAPTTGSVWGPSMWEQGRGYRLLMGPINLPNCPA